MRDRSVRPWVWASLILQFLGYLFDAVWHGLLSPGVEPQTMGEMARHLATVHLPLYIGAASVMDTHSAPVAGSLSFIGFLVVVIAMSLSRRGRRRRAAERPSARRAA